MPFELTPFDFMHLMDFSERLEVPKGGRLSAAGKVQEDVFIIVEGTAEVRGVPHPTPSPCTHRILNIVPYPRSVTVDVFLTVEGTTEVVYVT